MRATTVLSLACLLGTSTLTAQNQTTGYQRVACVKVQPGKFREYLAFANDVTAKTMQVGVDTGEISGWYLLRSVMPAGEEARCDFVSVTTYVGLPPAPRGPQTLATHLEKAGLRMTADEYYAKRDSLTRLVSQELWRAAITVGARPQKGDYMYVNFGKMPSVRDYVEFEQTIWKPMAEAWVKDGQLRGWMVNQAILPGGSDIKYPAISIDVFPSWEAALQPRSIQEMFKRIHSDKDYAQTFNQRLPKVRELARREFLTVEHAVVPMTRTSQR
jgi:hypothetical protein